MNKLLLSILVFTLQVFAACGFKDSQSERYVIYMEDDDQANRLRKKIKQHFSKNYVVLVREENSAALKSPQPIHRVPPFYPPELKESGVTGTVVMWGIVGHTGRVVEAIIEESSDERFNEVAMEAYLLWRFEPAEYEGTLVTCSVRLPMTFTLH